MTLNKDDIIEIASDDDIPTRAMKICDALGLDEQYIVPLMAALYIYKDVDERVAKLNDDDDSQKKTLMNVPLKSNDDVPKKKTYKKKTYTGNIDPKTGQWDGNPPDSGMW